MSNESASVGPEKDTRMTIWEHLSELRSRLIKSAAAVLVGAIVAWTFHEEILGLLIKPFEASWVKHFGTEKPLELQGLGVGDIFIGYFQLSIMTGVVAAVPIIFYQLWAFISPGLYKKEKRLIIPFVFFSTILFLGGVAFGYFVAYPFTFDFFLSLNTKIGATEVVNKPTLEAYLDFQTRALLAFGLVFELPLFLSFLIMGKIVTPKQLLKFSRWAVVVAFVIGAIVTPGTDIWSQICVSGALIALYFASLPLAYVLGPKKKAED
jgi:sec-independent protein translocase protein TatC